MKITKLKYIIPGLKFLIGIFYLLFPQIIWSQEGTIPVTAATKNDNIFSIGLYGGLNITRVMSAFNNNAYLLGNSVNCIPGNGYDYNLVVRLNMKEGIFLSTGISYEMMAYKILNPENYNTLPILPYNYINPTEDGMNNYNISLPLMVGYTFNKRKWDIYGGGGVEFYYNFENKGTITNSLTGQKLQQIDLFNGQSQIIFNGTYIYTYTWSTLGAYGIIDAGVTYKIGPKLSVGCMPIFRFTDPFAENPFLESVNRNVRQETFSMNIGINYRFLSRNPTKVLYGNNEKWDKISISFNVIPNNMINRITIPPGLYFYHTQNIRFSFSYSFIVQYDFGNKLKLESGIAIDNFNYMNFTTNMLIGIPVEVKYYFPLDKNKMDELYIGGGAHLDYPINIGWLYIPAHSFVLPLVLVKVGYQFNFGKNYFLNAGIGLEHAFQNIQSVSGNLNPEFAGFEIVSLPNYLFGTIGFGYKF